MFTVVDENAGHGNFAIATSAVNHAKNFISGVDVESYREFVPEDKDNPNIVQITYFCGEETNYQCTGGASYNVCELTVSAYYKDPDILEDVKEVFISKLTNYKVSAKKDYCFSFKYINSIIFPVKEKNEESNVHYRLVINFEMGKSRLVLP